MSSHELFSAYFQYVKDTEPPPIFHRWSFVSALGAYLGRSTWLPFGSSRIFPNQYIMLVGHPGTRKSTAIKMACRVMEKAGYDHFAADKTRQEKFLEDLSGEAAPEGEGEGLLDISMNEPKEVFVAADEFNVFMGQGNLDFMTILGSLWDWDNEDRPFRYRLKNSKSVNIFQPTLSILGGNTPTGINECFPAASIGQGFMSRLLLIHAEHPAKKIAFPTAPDPALLDQIVAQLHSIRATVMGPMGKTKDAENMLTIIYNTWPELEDQRFKHYSTRRFTHLLKLCIIMAACRCSMEINAEDVLHAHAILVYSELSMSKALGELGKSKFSEASGKIMQALYNADRPLDVGALWKVAQADMDKLPDMMTLLQNLEAADKIKQVPLAGSKKIAYLAKQRHVSREVLYYDEQFLYGRELPSRIRVADLGKED